VDRRSKGNMVKGRSRVKWLKEWRKGHGSTVKVHSRVIKRGAEVYRKECTHTHKRTEVQQKYKKCKKCKKYIEVP
jgi:hypothetical protein